MLATLLGSRFAAVGVEQPVFCLVGEGEVGIMILFLH
jgi:hypothetical protein